MNLLALGQSIHGQLAILTIAVTVHPAVLLRRGLPLTRGSRWAIAASATTTVLTYGLGICLYGDYRAQVKRALFDASLRAGLLFETKEHLAFFVLTSALAATVVAVSAPKEARGLRRAAALLFALAAGFAVVTLGLGVYVASVRDF